MIRKGGFFIILVPIIMALMIEYNPEVRFKGIHSFEGAMSLAIFMMIFCVIVSFGIIYYHYFPSALHNEIKKEQKKFREELSTPLTFLDFLFSSILLLSIPYMFIYLYIPEYRYDYLLLFLGISNGIGGDRIGKFFYHGIKRIRKIDTKL